MDSIQKNLQDSIYDRLTTGANKIDYRVYEDVPDNAKYPYVEIGVINITDDSVKGNTGYDINATFHTWSIRNTYSETYDILDAITNSITVSNSAGANELTVIGHHVVYQSLDSLNAIKDIDNKTRHGILTIKFLIEEV